MEHKTLLLNQSDINSLITMKDIVEIVDKTFVGFGEGTTITVLETKLLSTGNLWARCPSGWLCIWEKDIDRKFIK